jgi:hypothetical protein
MVKITMDNAWLKERNCGIHMTIRDVDCAGFDAERMARDFHGMGVNFFSFFAGGYVTTYPSKLSESRISPWLGGRDLVKEITEAAHRYGIKAAAMVDLSVLAPEVVEKHPGWAMVDMEGKPLEYNADAGVYAACIMGNYGRDYGLAMTREIVENYEVDAIKFGGGSYGFDSRICYCDRCREGFKRECGLDLPVERNWKDPVFQRYHEWKTEKISATVIMLRDTVRSVKPGMPVMGNAFSFGALDMERIAVNQEMVQLEAQGRISFNEDGAGNLLPITYTAEAASYITNVTETPAWLVVSYFVHAPWRRSAFSRAEQKIYMAQILAHGASPMLNLSGGPPAVHEDQRGFAAPREIWCFLRDHREYYRADRSEATVALVYSDRTVAYYGQDDPVKNYINPFRGFERALWEQHIPFDIISRNSLFDGRLKKYRVLVLANFACMREEEARAIKDFVSRGGSLIGDFETSLYDEYGKRREDFLLGDCFGVSYQSVSHVFGERKKNKQNYLKIVSRSPMLEGLEETELILTAGRYCRVRAAAGAEVSLILGAPFIMLPEGISRQSDPDIADPMLVSFIHKGGGRTVYFAGQAGKIHNTMGLEEYSLLLSGAVKWALREKYPYRCDAPASVMMSVRSQKGRIMLHFVNLSGGQRFLRENLPVYDIHVEADSQAAGELRGAFLLGSGELPLGRENGVYHFTLPKLTDYGVVALEKAET